MSQNSSLPDDSIAAIRQVFDLYDSPVWLVTTCCEGERAGFIATSVVRASIVDELPRILITVAKHHHTWSLISKTRRFALQLLASNDLAPVWRFGLMSGHEIDKFAGCTSADTADGNPLYPSALSWLDCRIELEMDIGDRSLYLAAIVGGSVLRSASPLTVGILFRDAPPERKTQLDRLYARDQAIDAAAICAWRRERYPAAFIDHR